MVGPGESLVAAARPSPLRLIVIAGTSLTMAIGAWWFLTRGKGQPEDPARVLVVGPSPELVDYLEDRGFDAEHSSFGAAVGEGKSHAPSLDDVAAVIEHADQQGIGFVAFDLGPGQAYDFATAGYDGGEPPLGASFAVASVGDLGKHLTYGATVSEVEHARVAREQIGLVLALFAQPELAKARERKATNDLMVRLDAAGTLDDLVELERNQARLRERVIRWNAALAPPANPPAGTPTAIVIGRPHEPIEAGHALADGSLLLVRRGKWTTKDGNTSVVETQGPAEFEVIELERPTERLTLEGLPESTLAPFAVAESHDAIVIERSARVGDTFVLVREGEARRMESADPLLRLVDGEFGRLRGAKAAVEVIGGRVVWARAKSARLSSLPAAANWFVPRNGSAAWVSDDVFALAGTVVELVGEVSTSSPVLALVRIPARDSQELPLISLFASPNAGPISSITIVEGREDSDTQVVVGSVGAAGIELARATLGTPAWASCDLPPPIRALAYERIATLPAKAREAVVAPSGTLVAWVEDFGGTGAARGDEVVLLALPATGGDPGPEREPWRLTHDELADHSPRFAGPGWSWLVFGSRLRPSEDLWEVSTLRAVPLD